MWQLRKLNEDKVFCLISQKHSYVVGRKFCDIILEEDSSISRKHATIYVEKKDEDDSMVKASTKIRIVDENSKYGIFFRNIKNSWEKLNSGEEKIINTNTIIRFGLMNNIWSLEFTPIIACTSSIKNDGKQQIVTLLNAVDGEFRNSWSNDCNLLIVSEVTLTVKVVLALINGIPIVNLEYLNELLNSVHKQLPLPDFKNFKPLISETVLDITQVSLDPNNTRKDLFKNKFFIFPTTKQLETLKEVIINAGGQAKLFDCKSNNWNKFGDKRVIVIQLPSNKYNIPEDLIKKFQELSKYLLMNYQKRIIPESEIAQAIAYSSTEKFCNPMNVDHDKTVTGRETQSLGVVLVEETPEMSDKIILETCVIPCSATGDTQDDFLTEFDGQKNQKRCYSPDLNEPQPEICDIKKAKLNSASHQDKATKSNEIKHIKERVGSKKTNSIITNYFKKKSAKESSEKTSSIIDVSNAKNSSLLEENNVTKEKLPLRKGSFDKKEGPINALVSSNKDSIDSEKFWNDITSDTFQNKRKLPCENSVQAELKKIKLQSETEGTNEKNESKRNGQQETSADKADENLIPIKDRPSERIIMQNKQSDSTDDFMELNKNMKHCSAPKFSQYNNSIYSLNLISSFYLKEDGSLLEPPAIPLNVKKFKKQKVFTPGESFNWEKKDDLSGGGWLEVHPLNTSGESIDGKYAW